MSVALLAPPRGASPAGASDDEVEALRRALWHDVRSVLAAATTNVEYIGGLADMPGEAIEVVREIEHELRLAADVIDLVTARRDADRVVEIDVRALVWLARRSGGRIVVDVTGAPFPVRAPYARLLALTELLLACVPEGATAQMRVADGLLQIDGADLDEAGFAALDLSSFGIDVAGTDAGIVIRRKPRA
jgi:hypothetical protein